MGVHVFIRWVRQAESDAPLKDEMGSGCRECSTKYGPKVPSHRRAARCAVAGRHLSSVAREQLALAWPRYASWWRDLLAEGTPSDTIAWNSRSHPRQIISPRADGNPKQAAAMVWLARPTLVGSLAKFCFHERNFEIGRGRRFPSCHGDVWILVAHSCRFEA